jgi:hypothetical protein
VGLLCPRGGVRLGLTRGAGCLLGGKGTRVSLGVGARGEREGLGVEGHRGRVAAVSCIGGVGFASLLHGPIVLHGPSETHWPVGITKSPANAGFAFGMVAVQAPDRAPFTRHPEC